MVALPIGPRGGIPSRAVAGVYPSWNALPLADAAVAAVDMPIGLPDSGARVCDRKARDLLGAARSRVFPHLRRPLLRHLGDYRAANAWAKSDGKGISKQAFNILPKIKQVDDCVVPRDQARIKEAHPELAFARLNGGKPLPSKATPKGLRARKRLLRAAGFTGLDGLWRRVAGKGAKPDDLYDACVLTLTARRIAEGRGICLDSAGRDRRGLKMEIWY